MNEQAVKDYTSMTDEQLNKAIAEKLGYTVVHVSDDGLDGYPCFNHHEWYWDYMYLPGQECEGLGEWVSDLNAAFELIATSGLVLTDNKTNDGLLPKKWKATIPYSWEAIADTPARAIVIAWLMYKDAQS